MATTAGSAAGAAARGTRRWVRNRQNRRALTRFSEFWMALQAVGDVLAEAEKLSKNADDGAWANRGSRHWTIATPEEIRSSMKRCRSSLRIVSASAKRFEPQLIVRDWRR